LGQPFVTSREFNIHTEEEEDDEEENEATSK
jgi:hypothetical protein